MLQPKEITLIDRIATALERIADAADRGAPPPEFPEDIAAPGGAAAAGDPAKPGGDQPAS